MNRAAVAREFYARLDKLDQRLEVGARLLLGPVGARIGDRRRGLRWRGDLEDACPTVFPATGPPR